jgi:hypothetical protein
MTLRHPFYASNVTLRGSTADTSWKYGKYCRDKVLVIDH